MSKRILFIGIVDSPHFARWVNQLADEGWDLHVFPVYHTLPHQMQMLRKVTVHLPWIKFSPIGFLKKVLQNPSSAFRRQKPSPVALQGRVEFKSIWPIPVTSRLEAAILRIKGTRLGESENRSPTPYGPKTLSRLINSIKPDLIHSMEFQQAGYLVLKAKEYIPESQFPKWLATNWGSDIYHYRNFPDHKLQIERLLKSIDFYSCECERDVTIARELGLTAPSLPVMPNSGGFDIEAAQALRSNIDASERRVIMVKGYQHFAGRALTALEAILACRDDLKGYHVIVFSALDEVRERVQELRVFHGIEISVLERCGHEKMLKYFAHARVYLGVSVSDGISTSMLEAMAMGAFPMQTDSSCCVEWIKDGETGYVIQHDDVDTIAQKLKRALTDDNLVDTARELNWETVVTRLDASRLKMTAQGMYKQIFGQ
ncbi:MAG: glycosyltransferase [Roseobacter sp.]